jgi:hypothetical protein
MLGLQANDYGGEEDPHGADQRGNPLGALMYSTAFGNEGSSNYTQVIEWSYFVGSGTFCYKVGTHVIVAYTANHCVRPAILLDQMRLDYANMSTMYVTCFCHRNQAPY